MNRDDRVEGIVLAAQEGRGLEAFQVAGKLPNLSLQIAFDAFAFARQVKVRVDVGQVTGQQTVLLDGLLETLALTEQFLRRFRIVPEVGPADLVVAGLKFASPGRSVKENS